MCVIEDIFSEDLHWYRRGLKKCTSVIKMFKEIKDFEAIIPIFLSILMALEVS